MQLFTRSIHLAGPPSEVMSYAGDMRSLVSDKIGREVSLWSVVFGAPAGTMVYSVRVDGLADLAAMTGPLLNDADYQAQLAKGRHLMTGPANDDLIDPLHGSFGDVAPVGSMATITTAMIANGAYRDAIAWSLDLTQHIETALGVPLVFAMSNYGAFGQVAWIGINPDEAAVDAAGQKVNADTIYVDKLVASRDLFVAGSGHRSLARRIA